MKHSLVVRICYCLGITKPELFFVIFTSSHNKRV
jgi:hypothetical protein